MLDRPPDGFRHMLVLDCRRFQHCSGRITELGDLLWRQAL